MSKPRPPPSNTTTTTTTTAYTTTTYHRRDCSQPPHPHHIPHHVPHPTFLYVPSFLLLCSNVSKTSKHARTQNLQPGKATPIAPSLLFSLALLSCPLVSCPVSPCPVLSRPVLACPVLSCPSLACNSLPDSSSRPRRRLNPSILSDPLTLSKAALALNHLSSTLSRPDGLVAHLVGSPVRNFVWSLPSAPPTESGTCRRRLKRARRAREKRKEEGQVLIRRRPLTTEAAETPCLAP